jgi:hypothetical protein
MLGFGHYGQNNAAKLLTYFKGIVVFFLHPHHNADCRFMMIFLVEFPRLRHRRTPGFLRYGTAIRAERAAMFIRSALPSLTT